MPRSGEQVLSEPRTWEEVLESDGIPAELKPTYLKFVLTEWERATRYHKNPLFAAMEDPFGPAHASYCLEQNERME